MKKNHHMKVKMRLCSACKHWHDRKHGAWKKNTGIERTEYYPDEFFFMGTGRVCENHKALRSAYGARRRAQKIGATPKWANRKKIGAIYAEATKRGMEVDHIIPLKGRNVSGLHVETNLQLLSARSNARKGNKFKDKGH